MTSRPSGGVVTAAEGGRLAAAPETGAGFARGLPFEWIVAVRFLREGRLQTLFIVTGIAIGVAVIVFMSALLSGLQGNFVRRALTGQPHVQLQPPQDVARPLRSDGGDPGSVPPGAILQAPVQRVNTIDQWPAVVALIRTLPEVRVVSPTVTGSALAVRGDATRAISLAGIDPEAYYRIVDLPGKIVRGSPRLTSTDILIGTELSRDLGIGVGDKLRVSTAAVGDNGGTGGTGGTGAAAGRTVATTLTVAGVFDLGNKAVNQRNTYVTLRTAQSLLGLPGEVSQISVTVRDVYAAEEAAQRIRALTGIDADSWIRTNAEFFSAVTAQTTANTTIRFFVGLSVAFGIASVLVVSVVQKSREIGILRAMGISRGQVLRVFLLQGGLLGLAGSAVGSALGAAALLAWMQFARTASGAPLFPLVFEPSLFVAALGLATATGLLAAFAPALRAARLDPVVAIRG